MFVVLSKFSPRRLGRLGSADSACKAARHGSDVLKIYSVALNGLWNGVVSDCVVELAIGPSSILVFYTLCLLLLLYIPIADVTSQDLLRRQLGSARWTRMRGDKAWV
jgi:hypothetical protein